MEAIDFGVALVVGLYFICKTRDSGQHQASQLVEEINQIMNSDTSLESSVQMVIDPIEQIDISDDGDLVDASFLNSTQRPSALSDGRSDSMDSHVSFDEDSIQIAELEHILMDPSANVISLQQHANDSGYESGSEGSRFTPSIPQRVRRRRQKQVSTRRTSRKPNGGRITRNPFFNFVREVRSQERQIVYQPELVQHAAQRWRNMSHDQKARYKRQALFDAQRNSRCH